MSHRVHSFGPLLFNIEPTDLNNDHEESNISSYTRLHYPHNPVQLTL